MDPNIVNQPAGQQPVPGQYPLPPVPPAPGQVPAGYGPQPAAVPNIPGYVPLPPAPGQVQQQIPTQAPLQSQTASQPQTGVRPKTNPNSTQNSLQIAEIRDGIVIMNDGSFRAVVMVKSINFDLMSPEERESVEYAYQGFLNSLYFPVQIFIRSQKVDLRPYIERLDKIRTEHENMLLALLMEDYIGFIEGLSLQTNIMDKKFYVVIPYFPAFDAQKAINQSKNFFTGLKGLFNSGEQHVVIHEGDLNKAKDELRNRVQAVLGGLQQSGIQGLPLDTQELIELYYDSYNPDTATRQQLKNFDDLSTPVVTKGQGMAPQPNLDRELS
ncbi:MAG: hypothetical protein JWL85_1012 [Candidatus Saccharibacteria bacterium]|nr:hypothetical protein [Candidatus Saccharibacteria bacterium]